MSAPGEIRALSRLAEPDVAMITRVAPVHLEFFPSVDAIAEAKAEILEGLRPGRHRRPQRRRPARARASASASRGRVVWFGRDRRCDVSAERLARHARLRRCASTCASAGAAGRDVRAAPRRARTS